MKTLAMTAKAENPIKFFAFAMRDTLKASHLETPPAFSQTTKTDY